MLILNLYLDPSTNQTMSTAGDIAKKAEQVVHEGARAGTGQVPGTDMAMGHPIHPATVHWPIAVSWP